MHHIGISFPLFNSALLVSYCRVLILTIGWIIFLSCYIPVHLLLKGHDKLRKRLEVWIHILHPFNIFANLLLVANNLKVSDGDILLAQKMSHQQKKNAYILRGVFGWRVCLNMVNLIYLFIRVAEGSGGVNLQLLCCIMDRGCQVSWPPAMCKA